MPPKRKRSGRDGQGRAVKASANFTPVRSRKRGKTSPAKARLLPSQPPTVRKNGRQKAPQTVADGAALGLRRSARIASLNALAERDKAAATFADGQQNSASPERPAEQVSGV